MKKKIDLKSDRSNVIQYILLSLFTFVCCVAYLIYTYEDGAHIYLSFGFFKVYVIDKLLVILGVMIGVSFVLLYRIVRKNRGK